MPCVSGMDTGARHGKRFRIGVVGDGIDRISIGGTQETRRVIVQSDGKIVVGGYSWVTNDNYYEFAVARYDGSGTLDNSFSGDGKVTLHDFVDDLDDYGYAMTFAADGHILVGGQSSGDLTLGEFD